MQLAAGGKCGAEAGHCGRSEAIQDCCFMQKRKGAKDHRHLFATSRESNPFFRIASSLRFSQ
jgi:hypothetical protein